jgi:hypothetical protein
MAKKAAKAAASKSSGEPKKITQIAAVEQICKLHPDAPPRKLVPLLKEKFGINLDAQRISMYRVHLKKRAGKPVGKRGPKKTANGSKKAGRSGEITVAELITVKETINKLGGEARVQEVLSALKTLA